MSLVVKYLEGKKFEVKCRSHKIIVDQSFSDGGEDQGMDPVELFNAGLASCAAFYALTFLSRRIKDLKGLKISSSWKYSDNPHRIREIKLQVKIPKNFLKTKKKV